MKAASHDSQTLKSVLDPLVQPLNLEYALRKDFIWISTPQRIATDPFGKSSLSAAQDPEFFVSTEIKVIEARHTFGSDALHDLKPLANARRIEGDAMVFTGPEIHIGSLMYPVERERLFDWIAPDAPPFPTGAEAGNAGNASQVKFELISAPRITTAPFHAGDSYKAKVLLNDRIGAPSSGRVAKLANVWNESTYSRYFLSKDFTHDFLNPIPESSPSQIRPKPAVILDFWTKVITSRGADGRETSVPASKDPNYGVAIGESTTVLTDTGELRTDLIFRMRDDTAFDYRGVRIADAKPGIEETSFRYEFQCKPDEVIGFALPYRNRGHLFVIVTFDYPMAGAAFRPA
ncbi:MAG: hypothetical protein HZB26_12965 [Candidatus Hydrogenedentes bacterium]|nr:hypothetical protein [Candidatus Hydrogenedentota bacterium]